MISLQSYSLPPAIHSKPSSLQSVTYHGGTCRGAVASTITATERETSIAITVPSRLRNVGTGRSNAGPTSASAIVAGIIKGATLRRAAFLTSAPRRARAAKSLGSMARSQSQKLFGIRLA